MDEAHAIANLLQHLLHTWQPPHAGCIAVITPYRAQLSLLQSTCRRVIGQRDDGAVEYATVDGFQGREAEVVVLSCVRYVAAGWGLGRARLYCML